LNQAAIKLLNKENPSNETDDLLNLSKMRRVAAIIAMLRACQLTPYKFQPRADIQYHLMRHMMYVPTPIRIDPNPLAFCAHPTHTCTRAGSSMQRTSTRRVWSSRGLTTQSEAPTVYNNDPPLLFSQP
jgi:hypothetical protein